MMSLPPFRVPAEQAQATLAAILRSRLPGMSWSQVRALIAARRVKVQDELCLDDARRLKEGDLVEVLKQSAPRPLRKEIITIRHLDNQVVVVEKPSGMCTVRHPTERDWPERRKALSPTLQDLIPKMIAQREGSRGQQPRLRVVHRLDKGTSGLVVFARTPLAERALGKQFHAHTVLRRYLALVPGRVQAQRVQTNLVRDRGDGRRGSTLVEGEGKVAITHLEVAEQLPGYTLVRCRLETGRTHQIRIHLAELGHPVCGDKVYVHGRDGRLREDRSGAPRLALHAAELGFEHPESRQLLRWEMPLPQDLQRLLERLRSQVDHADPDQMDR